jgi:hypothetical protein
MAFSDALIEPRRHEWPDLPVSAEHAAGSREGKPHVIEVPIGPGEFGQNGEPL